MQRGPRTTLALAVLELLHERAMHPYEMQQLMRERGLNQVIKLKPASLYSTVERLAAAGLIETVETSREGRRPERTVYAVTEAGLDELASWMRELLAEPTQEYPWFGASLAFLGLIPPGEAAQLLGYRATALEAQIAANHIWLNKMREMGLPRLFGVEGEYAQAMRRAELEWVCRIVDDIRSGALKWPPEVLEGLVRLERPSEIPEPAVRKEKEV
jgi:DNA-binding PadR family transcriptional regulator